MPSTQRRREGFTLIEVLISMTLLLFILGAATNSFRKTSTVLSRQSGRLEAQQTAQFTLSELDRQLRLAGVGVADMQPIIVQADSLAVTFNADLLSGVVGDPSAVYIDPEADPDLWQVFQSADKLELPNSTVLYPDSTYMRAAGAPSGAETISFWLSRDSTSSASNEYILWKRINAGPNSVVARGIVRSPTDTVFQFFKADSTGALTPIAASTLPLYHNAVTHGHKADTGRFALVDSIKTVRVRLNVVFRDRDGPVYRRLDHTIRLMNSGLIRRTTCGEPPLGVMPIATASLDTLGAPRVLITWNRSGDESAGERDVERYALYRKPATEFGALAEPFASVPAGSATYEFTDTDVQTGEEWLYGVAVQDCTPTTSGVATAPSVTIP